MGTHGAYNVSLCSLPRALLDRACIFCLPSGWGRLRTAQRHLGCEDAHLLVASGITSQCQVSMSDAARNGQERVVLARLTWGEDPNTCDTEQKYTPLHRASSGGHRPVVRLLLSRAACPNLRDRLGFSALHFACKHRTDLVRDLLEARCDVDAANLQGITPLHSGAGMGRLDVCRVLLNSGARPRQSSCGLMPSCMARRFRDRQLDPKASDELVEYLQVAEANVAEDERDMTWHFFDTHGGSSGSWAPCHPDTAVALKDAWARGDVETTAVVYGRDYHYNLGDLTQTNIVTGTVRSIGLRRQKAADSW